MKNLLRPAIVLFILLTAITGVAYPLLITAIALSMDAFAVSIGKGLSVKRLKASHCLITGAYFGGFQALMPLLGFLLASSFASYIQKFDHWIACVLLVLIGANMLREAFSKEEEQGNDSFSFRVMQPLAIATSIDALATGVTFAPAPAREGPAPERRCLANNNREIMRGTISDAGGH